jgi:AraC-like DNA-binding protein
MPMIDSSNSPPRHFSTAGLDGERISSFPIWRAAFAGIFDAMREETAAFEGHLELWATRRFALSTARYSRIVLRAQGTAGYGHLDHFAIRLFTSGKIAGLAGRTTFAAEGGDVLLQDLSQDLTLRCSVEGGATSDVTLWIPRGRFAVGTRDEYALHGLVLKSNTATGAVVGASLRSLSAHVGCVNIQELDALASGLTALVCCAAAYAPVTAAQTKGATPLDSFITIRGFIDRNLSSPKLGAKMIAASFGLSRASLYRLFEPVGGVAGYIRKRRLQRAFQEITASGRANRRIGPIAYRLGFKNVSAFSRTFRSVYGMSPADARRADREEEKPANPPPADAEFSALHQWLTELKP